VKSNLETLLLPLFRKNIVLLISLLQRGAVITHPAMWMPPLKMLPYCCLSLLPSQWILSFLLTETSLQQFLLLLFPETWQCAIGHLWEMTVPLEE
jgi:hypothetical protein